MQCGNCGRQNVDGVQFCGFCGAQLGAPGQYPAGAYPQRRGGGDKTVVIVVIAVVGLGLLFVFGLMAAILFPVFSRAKGKAMDASCLSNLKQLDLAALMYAQDYDQVLPRGANWSDAFMPYTKNAAIYVCPGLPGERCGYAFNAGIAGKPLARISAPQNTVSLFDAKGGWNRAGGSELLDPRHNGGANIGFMDGHVKWQSGSSAGGLQWKP